jgi:DNA-binding NarL/FixJ family response regulator
MRVIVADDDAVVVSSLGIVLGAQEDIEVVGSGTSGEEAVRLWKELSPDVALLDIQMPGCDGLTAAERILADDPAARIVFLTTFADDEYIVRALRLGARGYLIKQDVATIAPALRSVMRGQSVLEGEVLEKAVTLREKSSDEPDVGDMFPQLTAREREVVRLLAEGLDNREIATAAYMSEGTVRNHISDILAKLGLRNRTQIAVAYWRALAG